MFPFITGLPLSEYIRRRRLTLAAFELQTTNIKVIDIAVKYGYNSPDTFTRAFKNLHGVTPISARNKHITLKAYPKMTFSVINIIRGGFEMNNHIEQENSVSLKLIDVKDVAQIVECLNKNDVVVLDFENFNDAILKRRVVDFSHGAISALGGELIKENGNIVVLKKEYTDK
jgi:AraC-like DNA-binding protein